MDALSVGVSQTWDYLCAERQKPDLDWIAVIDDSGGARVSIHQVAYRKRAIGNCVWSLLIQHIQAAKLPERVIHPHHLPG
jgi:hypothetical protein